jgi:uncharacterized RDD family membrane protein YckC
MDTPRPELLGTRYERAFAFVLDLAVAGAAATVLGVVLTLSTPVSVALGVLIAVAAAPGFACRLGERNGQTLGKQAVGLRALRDDGAPMDVRTALLRESVLKYVLGFATGGLLWLASGLASFGRDDRRMLHDRLAGTFVARSDQRWVSAPAEVIPPPQAAEGPAEFEVRA